MEDSTEIDITEEKQVFDRLGFHLSLTKGSDLAFFLIKEDTLFDTVAAQESKKILEEINPGTRYFLLVGSGGFFQITKRARKLGADAEFSSHLAAVACYTTNASLVLIGELYNKINKPAVKTRMFYTKEAAMEWLQEQRTAQADV